MSFFSSAAEGISIIGVVVAVIQAATLAIDAGRGPARVVKRRRSATADILVDSDERG